MNARKRDMSSQQNLCHNDISQIDFVFRLRSAVTMGTRFEVSPLTVVSPDNRCY